VAVVARKSRDVPRSWFEAADEPASEFAGGDETDHASLLLGR
jgi:hypothetical protein